MGAIPIVSLEKIMRNSHDTVLTVVHQAGTVIKVPVTLEEYDKVLAFLEKMRGGVYSNKPYYGTDVHDLPYSVMLGTESLAIFLDCDSNPSEGCVKLFIAHEKGGEATIVVKRHVYESLVRAREAGEGSFSNWAKNAVDANGLHFRLMMGTETVGLRAEPVSAWVPGDM